MVMEYKFGEDYYEDKFVKVKDGKLFIKLYFFPIGDKHIKISDIRKIKYARQTESYAKNWGSSSFTWWACDMGRNFREEKGYSNVSVDSGGFFSKGFTAVDVVSMLRAMRNHLVDYEMGKLEALA